MKRIFQPAVWCWMVLFSLGSLWAGDTAGSISSIPWGQGPDGKPVQLFTLKSPSGIEAKITNYGGIIVALLTPDRNGNLGDIVLGYDRLEDYLKASPYFGALIGRCANRIDHGRFMLAGKEIKLATNDKTNHLHGGIRGFDKVVWTATPQMTEAGPALTLKYLSCDGEEGYPGNLDVTAVYTLLNSGALRLEFTATTDKLTVCNLTNHSYFNLAGTGDILNHELTIPADAITPVNETFIPTGEFMAVKGTPFDFNTPCRIGARIGQDDPQLKNGLGYDHNWVLRKTPGKMSLCASVFDPSSGRELQVWSTEPGVQFYSGNFLDSTNIGKGGKVYAYRTALVLEPQHFPDSPNHQLFPSVRLHPGETYCHVIEYRFGVR